MDLAEANRLSLKSPVRAGQQLVIPRAPTALTASTTGRAAPEAVAARSLAGAASVTPTASQTNASLTYRVKRGDTLSSIAQLFDTTVQKIKSWNKLRGNVIAAGVRLKIPVPAN
jgi:peptidoglycan lytic transglycosylase D